MYERFTERARYVVVLAQEEARGLALGHKSIGTEHLLLGLIREAEGVAAVALAQCDVTLDAVRAEIRKCGSVEVPPPGPLAFTPRFEKVCSLALREALSLGHNYIGTEHLLLGLVRESDAVGAKILLALNVDSERVRVEVIRCISGPPERFPQHTKTNEERWAEYEICKRRGHTDGSLAKVAVGVKVRCKYCETLFWREETIREAHAPEKPVIHLETDA